MITEIDMPMGRSFGGGAACLAVVALALPGSLRAIKVQTRPVARNLAMPRMSMLEEKVTVRFANGPLGKDVRVQANAGDILLHVADQAGIEIPRGCKSGVCGSCTVDVVDHDWTAGDAATVQTERTDGADVGVREGMQIVRACSTRVMLLPGQSEMVIDLFRMGDKESGAPKGSMDRFSGDWENEFVPDYKANLGQAEDVVGTKTSKTFSYGAAGVAPWDMVGEGSIDMQRGAMGAVSIRPMQQSPIEDPEQPPHIDDLDEARSRPRPNVPERSESDDIEDLQEARRRTMAQARAAANSRTNPANPDLQPNPAERPSERAPTFAAGGVAPWDTIW